MARPRACVVGLAVCLALLGGCGAGHRACLDVCLPAHLRRAHEAGLAYISSIGDDHVGISSVGFRGGASAHIATGDIMKLRGGGRSRLPAKDASDDEGESRLGDEEEEVDEEEGSVGTAGDDSDDHPEVGSSGSSVDANDSGQLMHDSASSVMSQDDGDSDDSRIIAKMKEAAGVDSEISEMLESEVNGEQGTAGVDGDSAGSQEGEGDQVDGDETSSGADGGADLLERFSNSDGLSDSLDDITYDPIHRRM